MSDTYPILHAQWKLDERAELTRDTVVDDLQIEFIKKSLSTRLWRGCQ
jgi:hypothetical protein